MKNFILQADRNRIKLAIGVVLAVGLSATIICGFLPRKQAESNPAPQLISIAGCEQIGTPDKTDYAAVATLQYDESRDESYVEFCQWMEEGPTRILNGVDRNKTHRHPGEPDWSDQKPIPWEAFAYGEYVGPYRSPQVNEYRVRVNDQIDFLYQMTRKTNGEPYRFQVGDELRINVALRDDISQQQHTILPDGTISPTEVGPIQVAGKTIQQIQDMLEKMYKKGGNISPLVTVTATKSNTELSDLMQSIQGQFNIGGIIRATRVHPDGTIHLPRVGPVPALGLTVEELTREVNFRYSQIVTGLYVSAMVTVRAPRFVYVLGEVASEGRYEMVAPTTALQALSLAGGENQGANLREIVVLRRDDKWRLMATRLDLYGAVYGKKPQPSDEIWLRDSDIVIVPKMRIQRISELVDLYINRTVYSVIPVSGISYQLDSVSSLR